MSNRRRSTAWRLLKSGKYREFFSRLRKFIISSSSKKNEVKYSEWRKRWVDLDEEARKQLIKFTDTLSRRPDFTLILDTQDWEESHLLGTIDSVRKQLYPDWVLHVLTQSNSSSSLPKKITQLGDSRIRITDSYHFELGDWIVELPPITQLHEAALISAVSEINSNPKTMLLYADHEHVDPEGNFCDPHMKPDWNPDLFTAMNYLNPFVAIRRDLWNDVNEQLYGQHFFLSDKVANLSSQEVFHIPKVLASVRINGDGTHLEPSCRRVTYELPGPVPTVSILIPTRNQGKMLERCLNSVFEVTDYPDFEVILVDHETDEAKALDVIEKSKKHKNLRVLTFKGSFNFSKMMNLAAEASSGKVLISLNNDTEIVDPEWLTELVSQVSRPEVGVAGALLLFGDNTVQHAGIHPGKGGLMGHGHKHLSGESSGYFSRLKAVHEVAAVTGACMAIEKSTWFELGGLDQNNLAVAYNDVDLCLKARKKGLKVIFTPYAKVVHHESVSRGLDNDPLVNERLRGELETIRNRWGAFIDLDPAYSPNLSFDGGSFTIAEEPRL